MIQRLTAISSGILLSMQASAASELFISEYIEGTSNNKALELYNPSDSEIDLSLYRLLRYSNGNSNSSATIRPVGTIAPGGTYVIANPSADAAILEKADLQTGSLSHNGDDAYTLVKGDAVVDSFGRVGEDPGSAWGSGDSSSKDNTLRRKADIVGDTIPDDEFDPALEWTGHGTNEFSDLGSFNGSSGGGGGGGGGGGALSCNEPYSRINEIQGNSFSSPVAGTIIETEALVTADFQEELQLFYVQSINSDVDSDPSSSEGLAVYTGSSSQAVEVGDLVRIRGEVVEFNELTELKPNTDIVVCATAQSLPEAQAIQLPFSSEEEAEAYEGMLVSFNDLTVNSVYNLARYGTITLSNGRRMIPTQIASPGNPANTIAESNALNAILLDDGSNTQNPEDIPFPAPRLTANNTLRIGDSVSLNSGVMHYSFDNYRVYPISEAEFSADNARSSSPDLIATGNLEVASFNVLNLFKTLDRRGADNAEELQRQLAKIVAAINELDADVVGLMEIQNDGYGPDSSIAMLVDALNQDYPANEWQYIDPAVDRIGSDEIAVGFIYASATVEPVGQALILDSSNSPLDESNQPLFLDSKNRPTLSQKFALKENAEEFVVAVNHLKSKGSNCNSLGDPDTNDGQGNCNLTRTRAAQALAQWLNSVYQEDRVLIIGDLNAYAMEDPLRALATAGYQELSSHLNKEDAYSYVFAGESGQLDHVLANELLLKDIVDVAEWHINADEPRVLDYNTEFKSEQQISELYADNPYRSSDHDPVIVSLYLEKDINPNVTVVEVNNVENLSEKHRSGFYKKRDKWLTNISAHGDKIDRLSEKLAALPADTDPAKLERLEGRIANLESKQAILSYLVTALEASLGEHGASLEIEVMRQASLSDKAETNMQKRQARFEQRRDNDKATKLEAAADKANANGNPAKAQRKREQASQYRAKAMVYKSLADVLAASLPFVETGN